MPVKRIWHGWTTHENAATYAHLLHTEILPGIAAKNIPGYQSIDLLRREHADEVEFTTVMTFGSLDDVVAFQGEDYRRAYVPGSAQRVLERWDTEAAHYEVVESNVYAPPGAAQ